MCVCVRVLGVGGHSLFRIHYHFCGIESDALDLGLGADECNNQIHAGIEIKLLKIVLATSSGSSVSALTNTELGRAVRVFEGGCNLRSIILGKACVCTRQRFTMSKTVGALVTR